MTEKKTKTATKPLLDMEEAKLAAAMKAKPKHKTFKVIIFGADNEGDVDLPSADHCGSTAKRKTFPRNVETEIDERYIEMLNKIGRWINEQDRDKDGNPVGEYTRTFHPRFKYSIVGEVK